MAHQHHSRVVWIAAASLTLAALHAAAALAADTETPQADDSWQIHGRVVDQQGKPVDDFVAATFWSANGKQWDPNGKFRELHGYKDIQTHWQNEGVMEPFPDCLAKRLPGGQFVVAVEDRPRKSVFVTDSKQQRGGLVSVEQTAADKPVTITLQPLVRVTGKLDCPQVGQVPDWTAAVVHPVGDDGNLLHFTHCGSLKGEFSFLLPPGKYDLQLYGQSPNAKFLQKDRPPDMPENFSAMRLEVPADRKQLDLGTIHLQIPQGRGDYSRYYGKEPPPLEFTDARGVAKDLKLADLHGKWVLLSFWSLSCPNCCQGKPRILAKFWADHAADRARFEILAICSTDGVATMEEFEKRESPIAQEACGQPRLPYPVLIDEAAKTLHAYGVAYEELLLDPQGHLMKWGDLDLLAEKLKESP